MKKTRMKGLIVAAAAMALLLAPLYASPAQAENIRLMIGAGVPIPPQWPNLALEVKKRVEAETPHKIEIVTAYGGSVAKNPKMLQAVRDGVLNFGFLSWGFYPNELFWHNFAYTLPFSTPYSVQAARIG